MRLQQSSSRVFFLRIALFLTVAAANPAWAQDAPPVITAPATLTVHTGNALNVTITAISQDPTRTVTLVGPSAFCGITFSSSPGVGQATGTLSGTVPNIPTCVGTFALTFTANDGVLSSSTTIMLTITNVDRQPIVTAPALKTFSENTLLTFTVSAVDPDGDAIVSLTASSSPATTGSTFTANASNTSGTFSWTPTFTQSGTYTVTFTAANALSGSASTTLTWCDCPRPPVVVAPATVIGFPNSLIMFTVSAADPDGQAITSLTASSSPATIGSTFTAGAGNTSGTFSWTPAGGQTGIYTITFTASNDLSGSASTSLTVCDACAARPPVVIAPTTKAIRVNTTGSFVVTASDPDGEAIASLTASSSPATTGSTFTTNATNTAGTFAWTPSLGQLGSYLATFTASNALSGTAQTTIFACDCQAPPLVTAPATISSPNFDPITFTVNALSPDVDGIASLTATSSPATTGSTFTVGPGNTSGTFSWSPSAAQAGQYSVTFTATDDTSPFLQGQAITRITVGQNTPARAFTTNSYKTITGKPQWCVHVEPVSGSFQITDIQLGSVVLRSAGTGSVSEIPAITGKTNVQGDVDNNGIDDAEFCFTKGNLQLLFSDLHGRWTVAVTIAGRLMSGLFFEAPLTIVLNASGGGSMAAVAPNPLNPSGTLSFGTGRSGMVRVRLFDGQGRLVRTVLDTALPAGPHIVPFDARDAAGSPLASGVYFYRVEAPGDVMSGRFVVAK